MFEHVQDPNCTIIPNTALLIITIKQSQQRCAFLMGCHKRVGAQSSLLLSFSRHFLFDENVLGILFSYVNTATPTESLCLKVILIGTAGMCVLCYIQIAPMSECMY